MDDTVIAPRVKAVENMVARARAKTRSRPGGAACSTCHISLWMSFFFDGTGNNKDRDFPHSHSNVAALFQSHIDNSKGGVQPFYYEGAGTPFKFQDRHERVLAPASLKSDRLVYQDRNGYYEGETVAGMAFGHGIDIRIEKAIFEFQEFVEERRSRRRVDEINIAAFGFSRGATTARAFMHWLEAHSKVTRSGNRLKYDGIPLNVKFLGLFDTVESVGGAAVNKTPELIKTSVPGYVEKCFHAIAAHELRNAFSLTGLGTNRYVQVVYPGAHADIGGGYEDGTQGRDTKYVRLVLLQMLDHARGAGLKMSSLEEMRASPGWQGVLRHSFDVPAHVQKDFQGYMGHLARQSGSLPEVLAAHTALYWAWIDAGLAIDDAEQKIAAAGKTGDRDLMEQLVRMRTFLMHEARTRRGKSGSDDPYASNDKVIAVPPAVEKFFETYVHDSYEHFSLSGGTRMTDFSSVDYYKIRRVLSPQA